MRNNYGFRHYQLYHSSKTLHLMGESGTFLIQISYKIQYCLIFFSSFFRGGRKSPSPVSAFTRAGFENLARNEDRREEPLPVRTKEIIFIPRNRFLFALLTSYTVYVTYRCTVTFVINFEPSSIPSIFIRRPLCSSEEKCRRTNLFHRTFADRKGSQESNCHFQLVGNK